MRWLRLWTLIVDVFHHVIIVHCDLWPQSYIKLWVISIWGVSIASSHSTKALTSWFSSCLKTSSRILLLLKGDLISDLNCISEMGQGKKKSVMKLIFGAAALFFFMCRSGNEKRHRLRIYRRMWSTDNANEPGQSRKRSRPPGSLTTTYWHYHQVLEAVLSTVSTRKTGISIIYWTNIYLLNVTYCTLNAFQQSSYWVLWIFTVG